MIPSIYGDDSKRKPVEDLRRSPRRSSRIKSHCCSRCQSSSAVESNGSLEKFHLCSCNTSSIDERKLSGPLAAEASKNPNESAATNSAVLLKGEEDSAMDGSSHRHIPVGNLYQAEVPEWTGVVPESDSTWLGTRMWPPDRDSKKPNIKLDRIGKGWEDSCDCPLAGSVECVRLHTAEKRFKLKLEIGFSLFFRWRFNRMGEEVSLSWTIDEENKFKNLIRAKTGYPNEFWKNAHKYFTSKSRQALVSYYFNVYLVQRRSYQNRVYRFHPKFIDSDDDEVESGTIGSSYGYRALYVPGSKSLICSTNGQCTDFD